MLLDNLKYTVHMGYLDTGDYFQFATPTATVDDVIFAAHQLTMTF